MSSNTQATLDKIVALCKRKGFVYPSAEIYGGINGVYDFGHLGTLMKNNIRQAWIKSLQNKDGEIVQMEGALLGPEAVWKASGHVEGFHDPMIDCKSCNKRYRADDTDMDFNKNCPHCGNKDWTEAREFNMMFKTDLGAMEGNSSLAYLRPETAQTIFVNFKNVTSTSRVKIPFGIAQMGKAFRNEITPKQFLFRMREFEQMEMQWFCKEDDAPAEFAKWIERRKSFYTLLGVNEERIRMRDHESHELAHYSTSCIDVEYEFPFGWKELEGISHRGNFDLSQHSNHSGKELSVFDDTTKESYIPHVVECSVGTDRLLLTLLFDAYCEDKIGGEDRVVLKLHPMVAPIKLAFLPLTKKLSEQTKKIHDMFSQWGINVQFDESGSIGKRYRRQDEIGTPFCITYDFDSEEDKCVTVRNRDTAEQERVSIDTLPSFLGF